MPQQVRGVVAHKKGDPVTVETVCSVVAWIIVIFLVLFALRIVNQGKARARRKEAAQVKAKLAIIAKALSEFETYLKK